MSRIIVPDRYPQILDEEMKREFQAWKKIGFKPKDLLGFMEGTEWQPGADDYSCQIRLGFRTVEAPSGLVKNGESLPDMDPEDLEISLEARISAQYFESMRKKGRLDKLNRKMEEAENRAIASILKGFPALCEELSKRGRRVSYFITCGNLRKNDPSENVSGFTPPSGPSSNENL